MLRFARRHGLRRVMRRRNSRFANRRGSQGSDSGSGSDEDLRSSVAEANPYADSLEVSPQPTPSSYGATMTKEEAMSQPPQRLDRSETMSSRQSRQKARGTAERDRGTHHPVLTSLSECESEPLLYKQTSPTQNNEAYSTSESAPLMCGAMTDGIRSGGDNGGGDDVAGECATCECTCDSIHGNSGGSGDEIRTRNNDVDSVTARRMWYWMHAFLGYAATFIGFWQIDSGLELLAASTATRVGACESDAKTAARFLATILVAVSIERQA